jgi:hypothetical protein
MQTFLKVPGALMLALACQTFVPTVRAHPPAEEMADAATHFLAALSPEQKTKATFDLKDDERLNWHFIPKARKGLPLKEMTPPQRHLAQGLLSTALSQRGYMKASTIMSLEQILADIEQGKGPVRDPELYFVSIFGKPGAKETWAWRWEGHHLAMNFSIVDGEKISMTPSFMGSNPAEVRMGQRSGLRVLEHEEDLARKLVRSLDDQQRQAAVYTNTAPADIITGADRQARLLTPAGLAMSRMNSEQKETLMDLVKEYIYRNRGEVADRDLKRIQETGNITFAWAGSTEPGQGHYYRIQGRTFLMEYDNTQNNANHIHAVWRDLDNDFGGDPLRRHYEQHHAK